VEQYNTYNCPLSEACIIYTEWPKSNFDFDIDLTLDWTIEVEVTLRLIVRQAVCLGIEHLCWTSDQILLPVGMFLFEISGLVSVGSPL
jgi:hypothetical protein